MEFFVFAEGSEDGVGRNVGGEFLGKMVTGESGEDLVGGGLREAGFFDGEAAGGDEAEADGFAVEEASVAGGIFDSVADCVAEVEKRAEAFSLEFILGDDGGFDGDISGDERGDVVEVGGSLEHLGIADGGVLDDFGEAFVKLARWQGAERVGIGNDEAWLMEGPDEIFAAGSVDAGLAADGTIDLGDDGGGDLNAGNAAVVNGGSESREVADHAAAESHEHGGSVEPRLNHGVADFRGLLEGFGGLSSGNGDTDGLEPSLTKRGLDGLGVEWADIRVGDKGATRGLENFGDPGTAIPNQSGPNDHLVG